LLKTFQSSSKVRPIRAGDLFASGSAVTMQRIPDNRMAVSLSRTDETEAFCRLFDENVRALTAYARRRVAPDCVEDVVADTFVVAWRRIHEIPEDSLPWLYGVARRVCANRIRAGRRQVALVSRLSRFPPAPASPEPASTPGLDALGSLGDRDREILSLVAWEGLDAAGLAHALGCSPSTARVRLHRARRRLERELSKASTIAWSLTNNEEPT
jgi:RNA polymerase sigma-70 factor (ECF subfamily)